MQIKVGTFNLNNLFSRYNFAGEIEAFADGDSTLETHYDFADPTHYRLRTFMGRLVKGKSRQDTALIAARIVEIDVDVLAVQEVEDLPTLKAFARDDLGGLYPHAILVEGNDPRLIDIGVLSKLPIGGVTSWQKAVHPSDPSRTVFGRDLLQVEILNATRSKTLFTVFNNHLKSKFIGPGDTDASNDARRQQQAEIAAQIIEDQMRPNSSFVVVGDFNDTPDAPGLTDLVAAPGLGLVNGLVQPTESSPPPAGVPANQSPAWTHRFKPSGQPAEYSLFDQIWLSPSLANEQVGASIGRRTRLTGDGSDHDPAWVELNL